MESKRGIILVFCTILILFFSISLINSDNPPQSDVIIERGANYDLYKTPEGNFKKVMYIGDVNVKDNQGIFKKFNDVIKHSVEIDTLILTSLNSNISLQFIALNPAGNPMPIQSVVGFNLNVDEYRTKKKWGFELNLPNDNFTALINVTTKLPLIVIDEDIISDNLIISFKDILDYNYTFTVTKINNYNAFFTIKKNYTQHGISNGDLITIGI